MSKTWIWVLVGAVISLGLVVSLGVAYVIMHYYYYPYYYSGNYLVSSLTGDYYYGTYPINQTIKEVMEIPGYVHVYSSNNTIVFTSRDINLLVLAMMGDDAEKMFNATSPPYAHGDVFIIYGLINPTLVIPAGATIHVTFVNLDDDMYHNFVVTVVSPPYPYNVMPYVGMYGGMGPQMMLLMRWLPPANYKANHAYGYEYTLTITEPGTYWYLCTYPGHAEDGMYGEIIVTGNSASPTHPVVQYPGPYYGSGWMGGMMGWW
ncbi:sulfocyanin-like copper-binding protein [Caldivirga sp. UBA161]|uniref:sulfocyanin-like copper-binding protein n=1 Tax=Caldivirga sp. UBA161 TaxID=1915569 RepID=UPI0025BB6B46|nr:sulfocyanin-like copper-binding protein [Caldivirga sp. UBA161]